MLQRSRSRTAWSCVEVSNPISGEVGAAAQHPVLDHEPHRYVSNPISGEVGAAARRNCWTVVRLDRFQTPSAGRWVLQPHPVRSVQVERLCLFQTPSAGRWVLQQSKLNVFGNLLAEVFQTPSAGRWVLQLPLTSPPTSKPTRFKPHQRGGGCCNWKARKGCVDRLRQVSNPISGEVGAATTSLSEPLDWTAPCFKPHQRGGGCCNRSTLTLRSRTSRRFKPHQRGGGCCNVCVLVVSALVA